MNANDNYFPVLIRYRDSCPFICFCVEEILSGIPFKVVETNLKFDTSKKLIYNIENKD